MLPPTTDNQAAAAAVRDVVLAEIDTERSRRLRAGDPDLALDDEKRLAASLVSRTIGFLRQDQAAAGMVLPDAEDDDEVRKLVLDSLFRLGPLQDLLDNPDIVEVNLIGCDLVWATFDNGTKRKVGAVLNTDEELVEWVRAQAMYGVSASKPWDISNPTIEFELPGGHRLVGLMGCSARPIISIRLLRRAEVTLADLQRLNNFGPEMVAFLQALVRARMNLLVSGETGAGKTTLLRALAAEIPPSERIVTIEHFPELGLDKLPHRHPEVVALEERLPNSEGQGALTMNKLVRTSRRISPDRLIVGECVGEEVVDMLDAMTQGNDGGFTTIHARSARKVPDRIATYAMRQGMPIGAALQLCANAVDFVIHMAKVRLPDGKQRRLVTQIDEVTGFDGTQVTMNRVWEWQPHLEVAIEKLPLSESNQQRLAEFGWSGAQYAEAEVGW